MLTIILSNFSVLFHENIMIVPIKKEKILPKQILAFLAVFLVARMTAIRICLDQFRRLIILLLVEDEI